MTADVSCGSCGTGLRANAKFCDECGTRTGISADTPEYKQVTVLFADVVQSMDIAATLDLERLREIMTEVVERSAAVVRRYGAGTVEFTGDGVMAVFGAPVALEDHALRACLAALAIQDEANRLADQVARRDGVGLRLRVGVNSGRVIVGALGSGMWGYTATGEPVGFAQRMESVAPAGGVMLSESTARLVERVALLSEPELVRIKGGDAPVPARRLLGMGSGHGAVPRREARLVGRRWEMAAVDAVMDRATAGRGGVVNLVGPPGIGKSRVAREAAALASGRGVQVFWTFCESHARDVPFHAVTRLLREATGVVSLDEDAARARVREQVPQADPQDLLLLDDLLGIADATVPLPLIDSDARRRRLTALLKMATQARTEPALYIIEDAHWIDTVSDSMLADLLSVMPQTSSLVLVTFRPEYEGALSEMPSVQAITLAPLDDSDTAVLIGELLGADPSVGELALIIAERAAGNPFFAEEMLRELVQRGVLTGEHGGYVCQVDVAEVSVPATVQAAIEARIDRLTSAAKRTIYAASVIGVRFEADLLAALDIEVVIGELLNAELIDQVRVHPGAEYAFRHPLIRAVAYESQLKSDRAGWHRRLAVAIEARAPESADQNAALIAEHLEAAGDLPAAYAWHMRAGAWSTNRDIGAARVSWERARRVADRLANGTGTLAMRIAPRTMLCATDWQARTSQETRGRFDELRELCDAAGDKVSVAIGMTGLVTELLYAERPEGSRLASEQMALLESIGNPALTIGLAFLPFANWFSVGEFDEILRWSQTAIDLAGGDPAMGAGFGFGAPLAVALAFRGVAGWWLGRAGWRQDLDAAVAMARDSDAETFGVVVTWAYGTGMVAGVLRADDFLLRTFTDALQTAQRAGSDIGLLFAEFSLGGALLHRDSEADRDRGLALTMQGLDWQRERMPSLVPSTTLLVGREKARRGDREATIPVMRQAADHLYRAERFGFGVFGTQALVETLLQRGSEDDLAEAEAMIDRLRNWRADQDSAIRDITLLQLRALLARARGDDVAFRALVDRYRAMAESLGFEGHIDWAKAMCV
ncbi:adenylate/guanylate cyclase domain-containing protein [Mycobacterium sp. 155]|uniref:AAA family ATPase n=1 Tax=Mycobacterium sp. 155 TaxID=1157943 RepID=UPI0003A20A84|nr:adenylate/guanylate cyclase domain-containing protein [Mycobacterium sp. 155]